MINFVKQVITNNNNQNKPSIICQWCNKPGHSANNCWKKQNEQCNSEKAKIVCQICNNFGYVAKDCRSKMKQDATSSGSLCCRYCKEQGHLLDNCELRIANNRRRINNQKNSDGLSKSGVQQESARISHLPSPQKTQ